MQFKIEFQNGPHTGGTKFYRTVFITEEDRNSFGPSIKAKSIFQYGPVGKQGSITISPEDEFGYVKSEHDKKLAAKTKGDYKFAKSTYYFDTTNPSVPFTWREWGLSTAIVGAMRELAGLSDGDSWDEMETVIPTEPAKSKVSVDIPMTGGDW